MIRRWAPLRVAPHTCPEALPPALREWNAIGRRMCDRGARPKRLAPLECPAAASRHTNHRRHWVEHSESRRRHGHPRAEGVHRHRFRHDRTGRLAALPRPSSVRRGLERFRRTTRTMDTLRIYADFNGLIEAPHDPRRMAVVLDTFGSARDLANAGVLLTVGLPLIGVDESDESEDLEGHGTAQYDPERKWWVIELDAVGVRYVPAGDRTPVQAFHCVMCRTDLGPFMDLSHSAGTSLPRDARGVPRCSTCGAPIDAPLRPPPTTGGPLGPRW